MATAVETIRRFRTTSDHYVILGVQRTATADEIKRAYKKLALLLHPDKCQLPGAEDAFKKLVKAHDTLTDAEKRRIYDSHGDSGVQMHESGQSPHARRAGGGFARQAAYATDADVFEEIFGSLFGGGRPRHYAQQQARRQYAQQQEYQRQQQQHQHHQQHVQGDVNIGFLMIIPILLFIAMNFLLSSTPSSSGLFGGGRAGDWSRTGGGGLDSLYSLVRNPRRGHTILRHVELPEVSGISVPYYVRGDFVDVLRRHGVSSRAVDLHVAREHRDSLGRRCQSDLKKWTGGRRVQRPATCVDYDKLRNLPTV